MTERILSDFVSHRFEIDHRFYVIHPCAVLSLYAILSFLCVIIDRLFMRGAREDTVAKRALATEEET